MKRQKRYLENREKNEIDLDDSDGDFDYYLHDIAMMAIDLPDPFQKRLEKFTLSLPYCYPLYLGFCQAGQTWNKIIWPCARVIKSWLDHHEMSQLMFVPCDNKQYTPVS